MSDSNERIAMKVSVNTIIGNVVLTAFKLFAGFAGHSSAMLSDAVHSLSDCVSTVIVIIGVKLANKKSDKEHPYGHERFECVASLILAVILLATGLSIGYNGIKSIFNGTSGTLAIPGGVALAAAIVSIIVKEAMYWYTLFAAKKIDSGALKADAWHHRSDALSSVGSFIGILGARLGFPILDPVACVVICLFIVKAAYDIFMDAIEKMIDKSCDNAVEDEIRRVVLAQKSVQGIDSIQTRLFGDKIYVDVEISVNSSDSLHDAHETAHRVHDAIEAQFNKIKHCMVHVNPVE